MKNSIRKAERYMERQSKIAPRSYDPARRQEVADFYLISEDHNAIANLPETPQLHEMPRIGNYPNGFLTRKD